MINTKCAKCKDKARCWSCDACQNKFYLCFICNETINYRDSHNHTRKHYIDSNQYLVCRMYKFIKHIS